MRYVIKNVLLGSFILLCITLCGCSTDLFSEKKSLISNKSNAIGTWEITYIESNNQIIELDKLEEWILPEYLAFKITIQDNGKAIITDATGKVEKEPIQWEYVEDNKNELQFWGTGSNSVENVYQDHYQMILSIIDDYAEWKLEDEKLIYEMYIDGESVYIVYERKYH